MNTRIFLCLLFAIPGAMLLENKQHESWIIKLVDPKTETENNLRRHQKNFYNDFPPPLESMLPEEYKQKEKKKPRLTKKQLWYKARDEEDIFPIKRPRDDAVASPVQMEYMSMDSPGRNLRRFVDDNHTLLDYLLSFTYPSKRSGDDGDTIRPRLSGNKMKLVVLTPHQRHHVGNALFHISEDRLADHHVFPQQEASHTVYGNFDTLGLNPPEDSVEIRKRKIKKLLKKTPRDVQEQPHRVYDRHHPALSVLFDDGMLLDAAKFNKQKKHSVYGNLENLGKRYRYGNDEHYTYTGSSFRRLNNYNDPGVFHQLGRGRPIARNVQRQNVGKLEDLVNSLKFYSILDGPPKSKTPKAKPRSKSRKVVHNHAKKVGRNRDVKKLSGRELNKPVETEENNAKPEKKRLVYGDVEDNEKLHPVFINNLGIKYEKYPLRWTYSQFRRLDGTPNKTRSRLVYGNPDNLGIQMQYDGRPYRVAHSGFRTSGHNHRRKKYSPNTRDIIQSVKRAIKISNKKNHQRHERLQRLLQQYFNEDSSEASKLSEAYDDLLARRASDAHQPRSKYSSFEKKLLCNETDSSSSSSSESGEGNPGNPYTIFKGKYRQNWLWDHKMSGDHMNINPYGPKFDDLGPTGAQLFFGRKWWYFNQDDYQPFRKR